MRMTLIMVPLLALAALALAGCGGGGRVAAPSTSAPSQPSQAQVTQQIASQVKTAIRSTLDYEASNGATYDVTASCVLTDPARMTAFTCLVTATNTVNEADYSEKTVDVKCNAGARGCIYKEQS